jgi:carboxyl-terminal processing protease
MFDLTNTIYMKTLLAASLIMISVLCNSQDRNPVINYNFFTKFVKENYGMFPYKNANWDSLTTFYSKYVTNETSEDSLFLIIARLAGNLRDKHFWVDNDKYAYNYSIGKVFPTNKIDSIFKSRRSLKNRALIETKYLKNEFDSSFVNNILYGRIDGNIGYLSLDWFDQNLKNVDSVMAVIMIYLKNCNSLILDIRSNIGGCDPSAFTLANYFVNEDKCYQIVRHRKLDQEFSYSEPVTWFTRHHEESFTKPIIVLINRYTISAAESFSLAMRNFNHIKFLGEPTAGAFSDAEDAYLPNGWHFSYSIGVSTDCQGILWEEKGVPPDITISDSRTKSASSDPFIEQALLELKSMNLFIGHLN